METDNKIMIYICMIGLALFGIIGGCALNSMFNFFNATQKRRHNIIAFVLFVITIPPITYVCYRSYLSSQHDPRTLACGEVLEKQIVVVPPSVRATHDLYYMYVKIPQYANPVKFSVSEGQFYQYAKVGRQVCITYISAVDMSFGHYNKVISVSEN